MYGIFTYIWFYGGMSRKQIPYMDPAMGMANHHVSHSQSCESRYCLKMHPPAVYWRVSLSKPEK